MMDYLVSLVIPIYKVEKYLDRCIQSIISQMDDSLEVILVDDGSPDRCPEICDEYASKFSNIKVIHKQNGGLADAVKTGTVVSKGEYLAYVDSDDWLEQGWYDSIKEVLDRYPNIDIIMYGFQRVENGVIKTNMCPYSLFEEGYHDGEYVIQMKKKYMKPGGIGPTRWNKVYSREIALECLEYYDARISIGEDMVFSSIATDLMRSTYIIKKNFVNYYINDGSMTQHFNGKYETSFEVLFQNLQRYFGNRSILYYIHYINMRTMVNALGKSDYPQKRLYLREILKKNSSRIKRVEGSDLDNANRIMKQLMLFRMAFLLLGISAFYNRMRR